MPNVTGSTMDDSADARIPGVPRVNVALTHIPAEGAIAGVVQMVLIDMNVIAHVVAEILVLVPDPALWRLTITGDLAASFDDIRSPGDENPYTIRRGSGYAGAVTLPASDGTFDVLISVDALLSVREEDDSDPHALLNHVAAAARHIGRHEAGHIALALRGEDSREYRDSPLSLTPTEMGWTHVLAAHVDDNRIEQHTRAQVPSPHSQLEHLEDAIRHTANELNEAKQSWGLDIRAAARRSEIAVNSLIRVVAYLSAELGLNPDGSPVCPAPLPAKWDRYLAPFWDRWSIAFHRLRAADQPMAKDELAAVLADLCVLTVEWCTWIGYVTGVQSNGSVHSFRTREEY